MTRIKWISAGLWFLAGQAALVGVWALMFPGSFYDSFPGFGMSWVAALPDYSEHLVTDVGAFYLGFALLFGWAVLSEDRRLTMAACTAFLVFALPHFSYHFLNSGDLEPLDRSLQNGSLLGVVLVAGAILWARANEPTPRATTDAEPTDDLTADPTEDPTDP